MNDDKNAKISFNLSIFIAIDKYIQLQNSQKKCIIPISESSLNNDKITFEKKLEWMKK